MKDTQLAKWERFKTDLPHTKPPYAARNWGTGLHSLCSYQGKLKPSLAHHLVHALTEEGDTVFDPFSGSGTVALEAAISGRNSISSDLSLMAYAITSAKVGSTRVSLCFELISELERYINSCDVCSEEIDAANRVKFNGPIQSYFHEKTFLEVLKARKFFSKRVGEEDANLQFVLSSMLHILHGNRPYALSRRSHPLTPYAPTGEFEYKSVVQKLRAKVLLSHDHKDKVPLLGSHRVGLENVLELRKCNGPVADAVITSPPFANSTRFYMTNWMRFWFCGWELEDFSRQTEEYVESKQKSSMNIYADIFDKLRCRLSDTGIVALHLGNNGKTDMGAAIAGMEFPGYQLIDFFDEDVANKERHGVKDKGSTKSHQYVLFRRT